MNIFILDKCPVKSAKMQCDKHVVKMILESAQMLSAVHHVYGSKSKRIYKLTHRNHPCTKWVCKNTGNYNWLYKHFQALLSEYTHRYNKQHKSGRLSKFLSNPPSKLPVGRRTKFVLAMPDEYKCDDPVESYRDYYYWKDIQKNWTNRDIPDFMI